ncbi:MAG TPA: hypothetical protein VF180_01240, partial [Acidimicrobiia bacterium]
PGPPTNQRKGQLGTCLMHPSTVRVAKAFDDPAQQPPDPVPLPQHSHLLPATSAPAGWWNLRGVSIRSGPSGLTPTATAPPVHPAA